MVIMLMVHFSRVKLYVMDMQLFLAFYYIVLVLIVEWISTKIRVKLARG